MKRILAVFLAVMLLAGLIPATALAGDGQRAHGRNAVSIAEENASLGWSISKINVSFLDETMNVKTEIMEIDGGIAAPVYVDLDYTRYVDLTFSIFQQNGKEKVELATSRDGHFSFMADEAKPEWPLYLNVYAGDDGTLLDTSLLGIRINKGFLFGKVPDRISSEFGAGFMVDMSDFLPGMELDVLPFMIPITVKTYEDGRVRMGLGVNSTDAEFWANAAKGELPETQLASDLQELIYGDPKNLNQVTGENMGLVVIFSGWAEGKANSTDPIKGHMQLFVGTGFDAKGQYAIFTWEIILMGGAEGLFDFSYVYDEEHSEYHFNADEIRLGVIGSLEVYGGIGCSLASIGVYGKGSVQYQSTIYPDAEMEHLIVAGELGIKAKLFGKVIFCFKIISGSHDFVNRKKAQTYLAMGVGAEETRNYLLENDYGGQIGVLREPGGSVTWYGTDVEAPTISNDWEDEQDFSHLLAEDIYPDNHVQIVSTGSTIPMMELIHLGSDNTRAEGNRSVLMGSYYDLSLQFISDPVPIADDGTADYEPCLYGAENGKAYVVWQNANQAISTEMTFSEIAATLDLSFSSAQVGGVWSNAEKVTDLAGSAYFPAGARITADRDGNPVIAYYTNAVEDPAGLSGEHTVYLATRDDLGTWSSSEVCRVSGMIGEISVSPFGYTMAVSVSWTEGDETQTAVFRDGQQIWNKDGASHGKFLGQGYDGYAFTWFENGQIYVRNENGQEDALTPADLQVPDTDYEIFGRLGTSTVMVVGTASADGTANAFAIVSLNGGTTWGRTDLTFLREEAFVSHISAAFTNENEPVVIYSVQNYAANVNIDAEIAEPSLYEDAGEAGILIGTDDERFTDTRADLYIKARRVNEHLSIVAGEALEAEKNRLGQPAKVQLTVKNTGLYPLSTGKIYWEGTLVGTLNETIEPGETADIEVEAVIPARRTTEEVSFTFESVTREDEGVDSRLSLPIDPGYLTTKMWHAVEFDQEVIKVEVTNHGYTDKEAIVVVRDEARDVTILESTIYVTGGGTSTNDIKPSKTVFAEDGCEDVTVYVLIGDEQPGDPAVSLNRTKSVVPLPVAYGQEIKALSDAAEEEESPASEEESQEDTALLGGTITEMPNTGKRTAPWVFVICGVVAMCAAGAGIGICRKKKKKSRE